MKLKKQKLIAIAAIVVIALTGVASFQLLGRRIDNVSTSGAATSADADLNRDGLVDVLDLTLLLGEWGSRTSAYDLNADALINVRDLSILLSRWSMMTCFDPSQRLGGGNFWNGRTDPETIYNLRIINDFIGAGGIRIGVFNYWADGKPTPKLDDQILAAHAAGTDTVLLLFGATTSDQLGGADAYAKWYNIGRAFATRYAPNSSWLQSQGIRDWGVRYYTAFNEPANTGFHPVSYTVDEYIAALKAFGKAVHDVDSRLKVAPGGFRGIDVPDLDRYGARLAVLWNEGYLDALDLHNYFPGDDFNNRPQALFNSVKATLGITRNIEFWSTEFNTKDGDSNGGPQPEAKKDLLTKIWDHLIVVDQNGRNVNNLSYIWNFWNEIPSETAYVMADSVQPYKPNIRGGTVQMVANLTKGTCLTSYDPPRNSAPASAVYTLEGAGKKIWVWQNELKWSTLYGTSFTIRNIPTSATKLEVYKYDSWQTAIESVGRPAPFRTIPLDGQTTIVVDSLTKDQTYMFVAR